MGSRLDDRRHRSVRKFYGSTNPEAKTGHAPMFFMRPVLELSRLPEGGGFPVGFAQAAYQLMGVSNPDAVLHLCSGSVRARLTVDLRSASLATIRADVRWLPIRPSSVRWILADPPYGAEYAEALWGLGREYPTPINLLRECAMALAPGGLVGFLHQIVPRLPPALERVGTWGVSTGPGYRMRAFTVARRRLVPPTLGGCDGV